MKKNRSLVLLIMLTLIFASCNSPSTDSETSDNHAQTSTDTSLVSQETTSDNITDEQQPEAEPDITKSATKNTTENTSDDEETDIDVSLLDRALLSSITVDFPDSSKVESVETSRSTFDDVESVEVTNAITYTKGLNSRVESTTEGVTEIIIYNFDTRTEYEYTSGNNTGYLYTYEDDDLFDTEEMQAYKGQTLLEFFETELNFDVEVEIKAKQDKVAGRKAVLIELIPIMTEEELEEELDGESFVYKIWVDKEYFQILKYELVLGTFINSTYEVTDIEYNKNLSDDLFIPPSNITFN